MLTRVVTLKYYIFVITNCLTITTLFFTKINFCCKFNFLTKILYYENLEPYGILLSINAVVSLATSLYSYYFSQWQLHSSVHLHCAFLHEHLPPQPLELLQPHSTSSVQAFEATGSLFRGYPHRRPLAFFA